MGYCLSDSPIGDFRGYPFETFTYTKTQSFQRNNCGGGQTGSFVEFSKNYNSSLSYEHAVYLAQQDTSTFNSQGQTYANSNGTCSTPGTLQSIAIRISYVNQEVTKDVDYIKIIFYDSGQNNIFEWTTNSDNAVNTFVSVPTSVASVRVTVRAKRYNWFHDTDAGVWVYTFDGGNWLNVDNDSLKFGEGINTWQTKQTNHLTTNFGIYQPTVYVNITY